MSASDFLVQTSSRHAVFIQQYSAGQANEAKKLIGRLRRDVVSRLAQEPTNFRVERLNTMLISLDELYAESFGELSTGIKQT